MHRNKVKYSSDLELYSAAISVSDIDMIKWLYKNGYPITNKVIEEALDSNEYEIAEWLKRHL